MKNLLNKLKVLILVILIAILAALLYRPVSILIFHMSEPTFICPIELKEGLKIRKDDYGSGEFEAKRRGGRAHSGVDIEAPVGTPVLAAKSGRAYPKRNPGMGTYVVVRHIDGSSTVYGHLSKAHVRGGQRVKRGDIIGEVGKTGNAWNPAMLPHLHFEIRLNDEPVDPLAGYMQVN